MTGGKARWETHCPRCDMPNGGLDMVRAGRELRYIFHCPVCQKTSDVALVMGPTEALRSKYLELLRQERK